MTAKNPFREIITNVNPGVGSKLEQTLKRDALRLARIITNSRSSEEVWACCRALVNIDRDEGTKVFATPVQYLNGYLFMKWVNHVGEIEQLNELQGLAYEYIDSVTR